MKKEYALTNPISLIVDKPKEEFTREDLIKVIEKKEIERITFRYIALDGKLKELKIPIANREQAERILTDGERVDGSSLFKGMVDVALSDLYVVPKYKTAFLNPFDNKSLDLVCRYITADGQRAPFALDNILHNAAKQFRKNSGLDLYALGELEFFLIGNPGSRLYSPQNQRGYHSSAPFVKTGDFLNEMIRYITQITGSVKYAHSEVGSFEKVRSNLPELSDKPAEQLEIEFLPAPVEDAADYLVLARWLIRNTAYKHGFLATFTPKLEEGIAGNGFHFHMEMRKDGKNVMTDKDGKLSIEARKLVGGMCNYADTLTAFGNTVSSAYLRLVPNQEAPTRICWSDLNRSAMIRVPLGWSKVDNLAGILNPQQEEELEKTDGKQTVELRSPDGSALIHLLLAGICMAADWGVSNEKEALQMAEDLYTTGNIFKDPETLKKLPALPQSCVASANILLKRRELFERDGIFPPSVIDYMVDLLKKERDEHINEMLMDMPADDRLLETRKIMHKDLYRH